MDELNDMSLQMLLGQTNYNKLVRQKQTEAQNIKHNCCDIKENKEEIIQTIIKLIDNDVDNLNNKLVTIFQDFTNELFKHWELSKVKEDNKFNVNDESIKEDNKFNVNDDSIKEDNNISSKI
tara:strand:+ start:451 stop:816 length:366 start_codon:yes stop_codon:yes gene_type:complete